MSIQEFSDRFDVLLNSYINPSQFGNDTVHANISLDEYEKSLYLTESQDELYVQLYTGRNSMGDAFENTEELRSYLYSLQESEKIILEDTTKSGKFYNYLVKLPSNLQFITMESVEYDMLSCIPTSNITVAPVERDEWHRLKNNPFRGPNDTKVLRMDSSNGNVRVAELISVNPICIYTVSYLRKLRPIILVDLKKTNITIKGEYEKSKEVDLPEYLHDIILTNAVHKAAMSRGIVNNNNKE